MGIDPADFERILQGFEPGGMLFPLVMAKVTMRGASGNDEVIEDQRGSVRKQNLLARCIILRNRLRMGAAIAGAANPAVAT